MSKDRKTIAGVLHDVRGGGARADSAGSQHRISLRTVAGWPGRLASFLIDAWLVAPLDFITTLLVSMISAPAILIAWFAILSWLAYPVGFETALGLSMIFGASGLLALWMVFSWSDLTVTVAVEKRLQAEAE